MLPVIQPMLAVSGKPFSSLEHVFEIKWDGYRALLYWEDVPRLISRNGKDLSQRFPEIIHHDQRLPEPAIFDGELVVFNETGVPSFSQIQRKGKGYKISSLACYVAFDLLYQGQWLMDRPLYLRRKMLSVAIESVGHPNMQESKMVVEKGREFFEFTKEQGLEGMVAKRIDSLYRPGVRSDDWVKVKNIGSIQCVIGGYLPSSRGFKSLYLGLYQENQLVYIGNVGIGFSDHDIQVLLQGFAQISTDTCPFSTLPVDVATGKWVEPVLVASIEYLEFTDENRLRHPKFLGLVVGKKPQDCLMEDSL